MATPAATIGRIEEFDSDNESISAYLERFTLYVTLNGIAADKQAPMLLLVLGKSHYSLIRGLVSPEKPEDKSLDDLKTLLKKHFDPEPVVIAERFKFYQRSQAPGESVSDFVANLRKLASRCQFGTFLTEALRDRLVCGMHSESIQKALLAKADLTLDSAVQLASSMEAASKKAREMKEKSSQNKSSVNKLQKSASHNLQLFSTSKQPIKLCPRCGRGKHSSNHCRFKNAKCHTCGKIGHISPVCRSRITPGATTDDSKQSTKWLSGNETEPLYTVRNSSNAPYQVQLQINNKPIVMEIDTGSGVSLIPGSLMKQLLPLAQVRKSSMQLRTYTGQVIPVEGVVRVDVTHQARTYTDMELLVVTGDGPCLLGRNWLSKVKLDWSTVSTVIRGEQSIDMLLKKYATVFEDSLGTITPHKATLHLKDGAVPRFHKPRPVPYAFRDRVGKELDRLESLGVIEKVPYSEWAAPIVVVPKKDDRLRICGDYKVTINPSLDVEQYPLPQPDDIFATLSGGTKFTTLDLLQAYNQLLLDDHSKKLVTINTHQGLYSYNRLPFGVASAPAVFQRTMESILQGIDGVACYVDDIIVTGATTQEHLERLEQVLCRLEKHHVHVRKDKCLFMQDTVTFLGHTIDANGVHTSPDKLTAIVNAPIPQNVNELRSFLGLLNYYNKFIPQAATILHPLNALLHKDAEWKWTGTCQQSFDKAKEALSSSTLLVYYDPALPIRLAGDASAYGLGAVIAHIMPDGSERPIAFASRTLTSAEKNYAQIEKEALALVFGVKRFHKYIYGRKFTLVTDHKPLQTILGPKKGIPTLAAARLQRWAWILSAYRYDIEFRPTGEHANADGLSRLPLSDQPVEEASSALSVFNLSQLEALPVDAAKLKVATKKDKELSKVYRFVKAGWPAAVPKTLHPYFNRRHELTVEGGCVMWGIRVVIPTKLREMLLKELHTDHPGATRMKSVARSYMWWPRLDADIEDIAKTCLPCKSAKRAPPTAPLHPWSWPARPWQRVHIDFAGPFQGSTFLIAVDAHSKWPEVREMKSTTTDKTLDVLREWFAAHGIPHQLVSDNGPQFIAQEFADFCAANGIRHVKSAPYHPSSNGLVERFVQTLKQSLRATQNDGRSLSHRLASFLLNYRTTPHSSTNVAPCELLSQRHLHTRLDLLRPDPAKTVLARQSLQKESHDGKLRLRSWAEGDSVMVSDFRKGHTWTLATIVCVLGPVTYLVETVDGTRWKRHADQIKTLHQGFERPEESDEVFPETAHSQETATDTEICDPPDANSEGSPDGDDSVDNSPVEPVRRYPTRVRRRPDRFEWT